MKNVILMLAFFLAAGIATANAQCHASAGAGKSCCASKAASAAAADPTIEKRQSDDGAMSYVRKEADQQGNVRFVSVQFDESQNAFVNVAPPTVAEAEKAGMVKKEAAACATGEKKACCAKSGKSCSGGKSAAAEQ